MWRKLTRFVFWLMHLVSWVLALYLFATGTFWGGVGCAFTSAIILFVSLFVFVLGAADEQYFETIRDARDKAAKDVYEKEMERRGSKWTPQ